MSPRGQGRRGGVWDPPPQCTHNNIIQTNNLLIAFCLLPFYSLGGLNHFLSQIFDGCTIHSFKPGPELTPVRFPPFGEESSPFSVRCSPVVTFPNAIRVKVLNCLRVRRHHGTKNLCSNGLTSGHPTVVTPSLHRPRMDIGLCVWGTFRLETAVRCRIFPF